MIFIMMMCNDLNIGKGKCAKMYNTCVDNLSAEKYYSVEQAKKACHSVVANAVWKASEHSRITD